MLLTEGKVWLCKEPTDMRKAIDGLCILVSTSTDNNPTSGEIFVFWNKAKNKIKILFWHVNGFCLLYKRLEKQRFKIPDKFATHLSVTTKELRWLLDGLDFTKLQGHCSEKYDIFY